MQCPCQAAQTAEYLGGRRNVAEGCYAGRPIHEQSPGWKKAGRVDQQLAELLRVMHCRCLPRQSVDLGHGHRQRV